MFGADEDLEQENQREKHRFWLTVGLAAILAGIVAALLLLLVRANENYQESLVQQRQSMEIIDETRALDASISRAEAALGRFAVGLANEDGLIFDAQWRRSRAYLNQLQRDVKDDSVQRAAVQQLRKELDLREKYLFDVALSANYNQTLAAISKYHAAGLDDGLLRIDRLLSQIVLTERRLLLQRSRHTEADRDSLNRAMWLFSIIGAGTAIIAIGATFSLIRATGDRRLAMVEQRAESQRAAELEEAVNSRTAELAEANAALRNEMTERENAETKLRQAQKMEALGQLTGGIAHDFNNMLAVVVGGLELAQRWIRKEPDKADRHLSNALDGVNRAADLTRRLLAFARADPARPETTRIDGCIQAFSSLIERTIGDRINLTLDLQAGEASAMVDRHQFENALLNLAVNGRDAMGGAGILTIRTKVEKVNQTGADTIIIQVIDEGCGMDEAVLQRLFDPFFTTKPSGQGTGLGMSQVFAFCRQSQGEVQVQSSPGQGTSVGILLPILSRDSNDESEDDGLIALPKAAIIPDGRSYHLLVVEDDPRVLAATVALVQDLGHRAIACNDPFQAGTLLRAHDDIDLVMTDVLMPGLTGPELAAQIAAQWPALPILYVTGYAGDATDLENRVRDDVLRKPFTLATLDQAIRGRIESSWHGVNPTS